MRLFAALFILTVFARCANQTSPNGGPQDKKPPALISSNPKSNQRNFTGEKIELTFDEYIKLKDPSEEIMISPTVGKETKFQVKKNKLVIVPKQKLAENTTYNISFRDAVQDINEGNPVFNLRLAFSTGDEIDSLSVSGNVYQLFKEEPPEKITVALYQTDTFNIFNHQPIYFTRTDKKGNFTITNLKAGLYRIYAFDDKSKNLKVESKSERFGFLTKQFNPADKVDTLKIPLMQVDARPIKITSIRNTTRASSIRLNKAIDSVHVESDFKNYFVNFFGEQQNEIVFYGILGEQPLEDSLKINLHLLDSVGNKLDTIAYIKSVKVKTIKEKFVINFTPVKYDYQAKTITTTGNFNKLISHVNTDSIYIQIDSTHFKQVEKKNITIDSLHHRVTLTVDLNPPKPEKDNTSTSPILIFGKGAFVSIEQDSSKARNEVIRIQQEDELGSLSVEIQTNEKNFILQLLTSKGEVLETKTNIKKNIFAYLTPQEYKLRITIDRNANRKWDPGSFEKAIAPEQVITYKTFDGKTLIPVRANWEVGPLLIKF
ncbi:MAG: Ig-like domain-containing protein [Cytophagales bacterium]|jgi:uncharacterized protein (DUF2141 family)|nr:Ig-like domain-containing protein [Cytophagales bacterium]MCA6390476.1 Ig-like domain-containing protein [Cytophagales bacterium]MCA6395054.1 Ig-like domain-containing protein [Cytophagales bacterium]MCA6397964.1 Ig-like domain-containing protein [Cytophagales bacterium]MCA6402121.1 Ig-like domain-containing protein [Cytophagales bacterium]